MNSIYLSYQYTRLTNDKKIIIGKVVFRNLQVEGSRSLPCSSGYATSVTISKKSEIRREEYKYHNEIHDKDRTIRQSRQTRLPYQ